MAGSVISCRFGRNKRLVWGLRAPGLGGEYVFVTSLAGLVAKGLRLLARDRVALLFLVLAPIVVISYAHLAGAAHLDDLLHPLVGEEAIDGIPCYVMEGVPRHRIAYSKLHGWVRKDDFVTTKAVFLDEDLNPLKEARLTDIREVGGVPIAHRIEMKSLIGESNTVLSLDELRINQNLSPGLFTEMSLEAYEN